MYARTVSRSTDESTGPVMSKKPPMVILPPVTPPLPPLDCEPPEPGALGIAAGPAPLWAPDTSPCCTIAVEAGWVYDRIVITPSTAAMTTAAPSSETATLSLKPRDMSWYSPLEGFWGPFLLRDTREYRALLELGFLFSGLQPSKH